MDRTILNKWSPVLPDHFFKGDLNTNLTVYGTFDTQIVCFDMDT